MTERAVAMRVVDELHAARTRGDLVGLCRVFADSGQFEIRGASADKPVCITATTLAEFRPWLSMMVKVYQLRNYQLLSLVVEAPRASAHWRADITSKVTGITVPTELVDLIEIRAGRIEGYREFFVPR